MNQDRECACMFELMPGIVYKCDSTKGHKEEHKRRIRSGNVWAEVVWENDQDRCKATRCGARCQGTAGHDGSHAVVWKGDE